MVNELSWSLRMVDKCWSRSSCDHRRFGVGPGNAQWRCRSGCHQASRCRQIIRGLPNCVITPHVGNTAEMVPPLLSERITTNVSRFLAGEQLIGLLSRERGY